MNGAAIPLADARALLEPVQFDMEGVRERLEAGLGGYEIVHASPGLDRWLHARRA